MPNTSQFQKQYYILIAKYTGIELKSNKVVWQMKQCLRLLLIIFVKGGSVDFMGHPRTIFPYFLPRSLCDGRILLKMFPWKIPTTFKYMHCFAKIRFFFNLYISFSMIDCINACWVRGKQPAPRQSLPDQFGTTEGSSVYINKND